MKTSISITFFGNYDNFILCTRRHGPLRTSWNLQVRLRQCIYGSVFWDQTSLKYAIYSLQSFTSLILDNTPHFRISTCACRTIVVIRLKFVPFRLSVSRKMARLIPKQVVWTVIDPVCSFELIFWNVRAIALSHPFR